MNRGHFYSGFGNRLKGSGDSILITMNFDWIKIPKNKDEEKEQFDKLYRLLVQMSGKGETTRPGKGETTRPGMAEMRVEQREERIVKQPVDEFTRLKMDILANFRGGDGRGVITPLETCQGCDRSFYSKEDKERHLRVTPACREWVRQGLVCMPSMNVPFFSTMEEGFQSLLGPGGKTCRFCEKPLMNRRAHEKHLQSTVLCNRLAHHTFQTWYSSPALPALPAPSSI